MHLLSEITLVTRCTRKDAERIHHVMLQEFGNIGAMTFSEFRKHVISIHILLTCKYSLN
jgi:hypothetical protein